MIQRRLEDLFHQARELGHEERRVFLDRQCEGDDELRSELESLLEHFSPEFMEEPDHLADLEAEAPTLAPEEESPPAAPPESIGPYRVLRPLGVGGMGTVYLAEQLEPIRRRVAVKVLKLGMDTEQVVARFEAEQQAMAVMDHSSIAKVFDAGVSDEGRPYFVMEYVRGSKITAYCDDRRLDIAARLELFCRVCAAIHHAHQKGIIHRDIKPSNVLVTVQDGIATPKIIDFGIAKAAGPEVGEHSFYTEQGMLVGTPEYMSPEQTDLMGRDIDTRADIYSLGMLLYELLTGVLPFDAASLRQKPFTEILRTIAEDDPPRPSTRVLQLGEAAREEAERRSLIVPALSRRIRGDLDWITVKALEKDRDRRYESAAEFAADIQRHLNHDSVIASPPSAAYRARKFLRRHRVPVIATAAIFVALVGVLITTYGYLLKVQQMHRNEQQVADGKRLDDFRVESDRLWPPLPQRIDDLEKLRVASQVVIQRLEEHEASLTELRHHATSQPAGEAEGEWAFEDENTTLAHATLSDLVAELRAFDDPETGIIASLDRRLEFARAIEARSLTSPEAQAAWQNAIADIRASDRYGGLVLTPQLGLVPLGRNPRTGLWEFWHLQSGARPQPAPDAAEDDNRWLITEETGIVLVLIPGGSCEIGSQSEDAEASNYYQDAFRDEGPVHRVTLDPFFLSKYEMTQPQWGRIARDNPSRWTQSGVHPVESVSWHACNRYLPRLDLVLPTEAQWEYAARGGKDTLWWTGDEIVSLQGAANILDKSALDQGAPADWKPNLEITDGHKIHGPVGIYRANPFGLHDVHGNVWEWCQDWFGLYDEFEVRPGDGLRSSMGAWRISRGGSCGHRAFTGRCADRNYQEPTKVSPYYGVRPARPVSKPAS